jgi:FkbM family methyltransferase
MPVYNGARFLDRALDSLRAQTFADWELLAVDDASADDSATRLAAAAADTRIRVFRHPINRGPAAARNTALAAAGGELIAYLDCDDEFYPDHLARAWEWRPRADVLLFRYHTVEERAGHPDLGTVALHDPAECRDALFTDTIAVPLGVVHRRTLLDRAGYFDERLWRAEDADLWRRFARVGATFATIPHPSGRYHIRSDSLARIGPRALIDGMPSPVRSVAVRAGDRRVVLRMPAGEAWLAREVFERHEYGGVPPRALHQPPVVIDVGANVGAFAVYAKLAYHPDAVVHCFEPYPPTVELLRQNVSQFDGITVHPIGLGAADGDVDLLLHATNSGANSTCADLVPEPIGRVRVPVRAAGAVWDELNFGAVDVLKVDAEGVEVAILTALGPRLARVRVVMAEYHTADDRARIHALLPGHVLFGSFEHDARRGVVKYARADIIG